MERVSTLLLVLLYFMPMVAVGASAHDDGHGPTYTYIPKNETALDGYVNKCIDGMHHKDYPSKESSLHGQCDVWKDRSCCTPEVAEDLHGGTWYNFDWNHCDADLSQDCKEWLRQDLCFYECSPNVGPWVIEHRISIRNERFVNVPLCKSECDLWFNACKNDFTCMDNWSKGWNWTTKTNTCPEGNQCRTFQETFQTAERMCEDIWGGSFAVTEDDTDCMVLWFTGSNPNDKVTAKRAMELVGESGGERFGARGWIVFALSIAMILTTGLFV